MKNLITTLALTICLLSPRLLFAQKPLLDSLNQMSEIADKIIREQKAPKKPVKQQRKHNQSSRSQSNQEYNFTLSDALGDLDLSKDPVVQKAIAEQTLQESQNTLSNTSVTPPKVQYVNTPSQREYLPAIMCILIGILIWSYWARDYIKGQKDPMNNRRIYDTPLGCLPWVIAFIFIGAGIYLLF